MKYKYLIKVEVPTARLSKVAGDIQNSINETMSDFGFDEKLELLTTVPLDLEVAKLLEEHEKNVMISVIVSQFTKDFGRARVVYFEQV